MTRTAKPVQQRGVAVVTALLIAALVTVLAAQWFAAQDALGRTIEVQRNGVQARWLLTAATDWARLILREDGNPNADYVGEVWSIPLQPTRITDESGRLEALASGKIEDAQARFNLADLVNGTGISGEDLSAFQRLFEALGLPDAEVGKIAQAVNSTRPASSKTSGALPMPQIKTIMDLQGMKDISDTTLLQLVPYTTVYPRASATERSPININTASAPVLTTISKAFTPGLAQAIVSKRERLSFFKGIEDLQLNFPDTKAVDPSDTRGRMSPTTQHFIATGRLQLGRIDIARQAMLRRANNQTETIWVRDI
jgi:general secretion pathway protein K